VKKTCRKSTFGGVMKYDVNKTYIELKCEGTLEMHPVVCDSGEYTVKHCNTTIEPYDPAVCNGTYTELSCADGGNLTHCFGETKPLINIYCNGTYSEGQCQGFVPPTFSIIQVNRTHWLQGICSSYILNNSCTGLFNDARFVNCNGDPLNNQQDYESCRPIAKEVFGSCEGVTNSTGCYGDYRHPVEVDGRTFQAKCDSGDENQVYDYEIYHCKVHIKPVDTNSESDVSCSEGFNPKLRSCPKGRGTLLVRHAEKERPGITLRRQFSCESSNLHLKDFSCHSRFENTACYGKPIVKRDGSSTCLGDFIKIVCPSGGSDGGCKGNSTNNLELYCLKSYFDGKECVSDKLTENTDIVIHSKDATHVLDEYERPVKIAEFEVDAFTMINAESTSASLDHSIIKALRFEDAEQDIDGSLKNIKVFENVKTPIFLDNGHLTSMFFKNFLLDELQYTKFAIDDSCKLVHIKFTELVIKNTLFQNFFCKNAVVRNLQWSQSSTPDYGIQQFDADIGFGTVILKNVEVYLPYISKTVIDQWKKSSTISKSVSIVIPKISNIEVPEYKIHFDDSESDIYLEFPVFKIENKNIDLIYMADYVLDSTELKSKPDIVSQILEGYTEDSRITRYEQEAINETSTSESSKSESSK
jgi:hypothetical protein